MADVPYSGRFDGRVHLLPVRIYYEDTDFTGLVYHANYLRYFERGRSDFLRLLDVGHTELLQGEDPLGFAVVKMALDFKRAARIDDALLVRTAFDAVQGPRLRISQSILREGEEIVRAAVEACCISLTGRAKRPPRLLLDRLQPILDPAQSTF